MLLLWELLLEATFGFGIENEASDYAEPFGRHESHGITLLI